jgi:hypothetical protein
VEEFGAGSGSECVEALTESALEMIGSLGGRLRRRTVTPRVVHRGATNAAPRLRLSRVRRGGVDVPGRERPEFFG